jgi:hypothetical protein
MFVLSVKLNFWTGNVEISSMKVNFWIRNVEIYPLNQILKPKMPNFLSVKCHFKFERCLILPCLPKKRSKKFSYEKTKKKH